MSHQHNMSHQHESTTKLEDPGPGYAWQLGKLGFKFDIISKSRSFQKYQAFAEKLNLSPNLCRLSDVSLATKLTLDDYLYIVQKSPLWLYLRSKASGTASSLAKYIKGPCLYPDEKQVAEAWADKLAHVPFEKTHTVAGHMRWGVGYEDPALIHFAVDRLVRVAQVGCIHLPLSYLLDLAREQFPALIPLIDTLETKDTDGNDKCLLVSPDGMVMACDPAQKNDTMEFNPDELIGMLEIKCISPFHHMPESDGLLSWVDDMETRQWYTPRKIPFVYVTQICSQALSGIYKYNMKPEHTMWFIRWSPAGFSEFNIQFKDLVPMGLIATILYFSLLQRVEQPEDSAYIPAEMPAVAELSRCYNNIMDKMEHRYVSLDGLYPEFYTYQECTQRYHFSAWEEGEGPA